MEEKAAFFEALGKAVEHFESIPLAAKIREMEGSRFVGEDGKEYFKLPPPPRYLARK